MTAKKKNHRARNLILTLVMLAVVVGLYFVVSDFSKKEEEKEAAAEQEKKITILDMEYSDIAQFSYQHEGETLSFTRKEEDGESHWYYDADESIPLEQSSIETMVSGLTPLSTETQVEGGEENLGDYGLDTPANTVHLKDQEGNEQEILFGNQNSVTLEYYVLVDGKVYTVSSEKKENFDQSLLNLIEADSYPTFEADSITKVIIRIGAEEYTLTKASESEAFNWKMTMPDGTEAALLTDYANELLSTISGGSYMKLAEYNCQSMDEPTKNYRLTEESAAYVVTVDYTVEETTQTEDGQSDTKVTPQTFKLLIGSETGDGEYYVRSADSTNVHTMASGYPETLGRIPNEAPANVQR